MDGKLISSALIKKKCFIKCGGFDNSITIGEDWHLWFRFALAGFKFTCIQEDLVKYRRHSENTTMRFDILGSQVSQTLEKIYSHLGNHHHYYRLKPLALMIQQIFLAHAYLENNDKNMVSVILTEALNTANVKSTFRETKRISGIFPLDRSFYRLFYCFTYNQNFCCRIYLLFIYIYSCNRKFFNRPLSLLKSFQELVPFFYQ